ncbi:aspartate/glutamate racemase family protein [Acidobacteriota bacterium]
MTKKLQLLIFMGIIPLVLGSCVERQSFAKEDKLEHFFTKKEVTIAVVDSGLGGLSIMADALERMREDRIFQKAHFVFFNALFSSDGGYNSLKEREEKIRILDSALKSLESKYKPDLILIGCNTLSVLYMDTTFSRQTLIPVKGIIEAGVELITTNLKAYSESKVIVFGTQTTVSEGTYEHKLTERGFLAERIVSQACPDLVPYIERGYDSDETEMLIYAYVDEALQKMGKGDSPLYVSFNCTHYGYSQQLWTKAFQNFGISPLGFLNPNKRMNDFLFPDQKRHRFDDTDISTSVISMISIDKQRLDSIGSWLSELSPQTAKALQNYTFKNDLFEWKKFVNSER